MTIIEDAKKQLDNLLGKDDIWKEEQLDMYLRSALFSTACKEEEFLRYLTHALSKVRLSPKTAKAFVEVMEEIERNANLSMGGSKARLIGDIKKQCKNPYYRNIAIGKSIQEKAKMPTQPEHYKQPEKPKQYEKPKKKNSIPVLLIVLSSVFVLVVIAFIVGGVRYVYNDAYSVSSGQVSLKITEDEARQIAVAYMNEKYPNSYYNVKDTYASEYGEYEYSEYEEVENRILGYNVYMGDSNDTKVTVVSGTREAEDAICFDDLQANEIGLALQEEILARLNKEEGMSYLSTDNNSFISIFLSKVVYHTNYEGDLKDFFDKEAEFRNNIRIKTNDGTEEVIKNLNRKNINGSCVFYFPDAEVTTVTQRLNNQVSSTTDAVASALESVASDYQIQIVGTNLTYDFYQALAIRADDQTQSYNKTDSYTKISSWLSEGESSYISPYSANPPIISPMVVDWFISETYILDRDAYYGGIYHTNAASISDGIYVMKKNIQIEENEKQLSAENVGKLQMKEMSDGMENYLEEINISTENTVSFQINSYEEDYDGSNYILAIDKEKFGIGDSGCYVAIETPETSYSDAEYELFSTEAYDENRQTGFSAAGEGEGYIFIEYRTTYKDEPSPIITLIRE
ncbi:hypothetical protein [Konateibacter massiliensis]|uniref:hypothetical protein n=1 Tax=Konateibacter massiliensis TaxID=2002841 RepID=UPI000C158654|nr:hypothetical protein [Konateibacter massiliensis]